MRFAARSRDFQTGAANGVNLLELHIDLLMLVKVAVDVFVGHPVHHAAEVVRLYVGAESD